MTAPRGMSVPFRVVGGRVAQTAGPAKITENLRHLLSTALGERLARRGYGGGVHQRLQQPNDHTLRSLVRREIERAMREHLPQARLVTPVRLTHTESVLTVTFDYAVDSSEPAQQVALTLPRPS
ncbi:GPW/gp25 family protein [Phytomonospora sp. NPDC050363]|uniref:GPW/gp25 family protein n=1 Tax=Phytomonospora sp. NPDC050363 TaxID=3155642 RepID=UPI0033DE14BA